MPDVRVVDAMLVCLLIQEVEHVFDGEWKSTAPIHRAEECLEQIIHELLQSALQEHTHNLKLAFSTLCMFNVLGNKCPY